MSTEISPQFVEVSQVARTKIVEPGVYTFEKRQMNITIEEILSGLLSALSTEDQAIIRRTIGAQTHE